MTLTVTGIFENEGQAEDAQAYLLSNGFAEHPENESNKYPNSAKINIAERNGVRLILIMQSVIEAQEGVDVLNNHGAVSIETQNLI